MPTRLPKHLFDALTAVRLAQQFAAGLTFDAFVSNVLVRSAIERQLEILGEACQRMVSVMRDSPAGRPVLGRSIHALPHCHRSRRCQVGRRDTLGLHRAARVDELNAGAFAAALTRRVRVTENAP